MIHFRVVTQADIEAERKQYGPEVWHSCHDFRRGWFLEHMQSGREIYFADVDRLLPLEAPPYGEVDPVRLEQLHALLEPLLAAEARKNAEWRAQQPPVKFDRITVPRFTKDVSLLPSIREIFQS